MNNTLLIILAVALVAAGVVGWFILSSGDTLPEAEETTEHVYVEPVPTEPEAQEADPEPAVEPTVAETETPDEISAETRVPTALWAADGVIDLGEYAQSTNVAGVDVYWTAGTNLLRVGLESPGTGYVSIGFDPDNRMEGANYIVGYVHEGETFIRDDYGTGPTSHGADIERGGEDNILSSGGTEWADHTVLEFVIPLDSGDDSDKPLVFGGTYDILVAYHDLQDGFTSRHSRRGAGKMTVLEASP